MPEAPEKIRTYIDESFHPEEADRYSLVVEIERRKFSFCILDLDKNKFVGIGSFLKPYSEVVGTIPWITHPFRSTRVIFSHCKATLIPSALFLPEERHHYLDLNLEGSNDDEVHHDSLENLGIINVYSVPGQVLNDISRLFPGSRHFHVTSVLIQSLYVNYKNLMGDGKIFLNVRDDEFDLLIFNGKQLGYCNSFPFKAPEDLVYYLIFVMEQLNLNPEEVPLVLLGAADRRSRLFELLFRYVRNVDFAARNGTFGYCYQLEELPAHYFYTLFNSEQCGS
jgi:hypothetical protein